MSRGSLLDVVESTKSVGQVLAALEAAVARNKFGILGIHNLKEAMEKRGVTFTRDCLSVEVCNPHQAKKVLEEPSCFCDARADG